MRKNTKEIKVGSLRIGGNNRVLVQSMLNVTSDDIKSNVCQAKMLEKSGCDIIRIAIPNKEAIKLICEIKQEVSTPIVADIHFNYELAIESAFAGVDKIRINPGNIGNTEHIKKVADCCREKSIPIRIGVNSGSLEKDILSKYGAPTAEALSESALYNASLLEQFDFEDIVLSIKSSNVKTMIDACRITSSKSRYPLHLGVTEAGTYRMGIIKSAIGIGSLLADGIGDTIRVSLTADPVEEVKAGIDILKSLNLYKKGVTFVSCPTCGRTKINLIDIAKKAEERLKDCNKNIKVAIMGCAVNGPGEAKEADIGIAGGNKEGIIFKKGKILKKVKEEELLDELIKEIELI